MKIFRLFVAFTLICFAVLPTVQAVVPPPDGCYPGLTTAEGCNALFSLTSGRGNTGLGFDALFSNIDKSFNTAVGAAALAFNNGDNNTAVGAVSLLLNTTGNDNTAVGWSALAANTDGCGHVAVGLNALTAATAGCTVFAANTAVGSDALASNTTGTGNTAIGFAALLGNTTGAFNTAIGNSAGAALTTGDHNICIGAGVVSQAGLFNTIRIGDNLPNGPGESICMIGGIWAQAVAPSGSPVYVDSDGKLGIAASSQRFKHDIKPMDKASEVILALKPVTFHYKSDAKNTPCYGLIAEEVEKVNPGLVLPDNKGKPFTVRYDAVNAMLLNEFLKEHKKVEELESRLSEQQKQIESLSVGLRKVSAQLEVSRPVPQMAVNDQ